MFASVKVLELNCEKCEPFTEVAPLQTHFIALPISRT